MRGKKAVVNTAFSLLEELVSIICGFILPRLILTAFGSQYNGLITSITQFLACAVLLRSGIGGATRAALYKPIAEEDHTEIDSIVKATDIFMKKVGFILGGLIVGFAVIYPFLFENHFGWFFVFSLFVIIGISTFADSFFGITYLIVLQADQRLWVSSFLKIICCILNTIMCVVLIKNNFSIHMVKLGSTLIYVIYPIILGAYVKKHYNIKSNVKPNNKAIVQRWDAFWQQVAVFVMNNTDVIVLTVFTNMLEVSVYSIYNMVANGLKRAVLSFSNGLEAAFGNMIAKNEDRILRENVEIIECIMFTISTIIYTCAGLLILDFVTIYTKNIADVDYMRPSFAVIIMIAQFFNGIRIPYQLVVQAAGHYKQTKKGAIIEPIVNITLSIILVFKLGLTGVALGTLVATLFRTMQYSYYMSKNIIVRSILITFKRVVISVFESTLIILSVRYFGIYGANTYFNWCSNAIIIIMLSLFIVMICNFFFFKKDMFAIIKKIRNLRSNY